MKRAKIIATLGPASCEYEQIKTLALAGANVFRLNFSHSDYEFFSKLIKHIKKLRTELNKPLGILADISGPKIRISNLTKSFWLNLDDVLKILKTSSPTKELEININYPQALNHLKIGDLIYLNDGTICVKIIHIDNDCVQAKALNSGQLKLNKGINFPQTELDIDILTQKDRADIAWAKAQGVEYFALSFVQNAEDIRRAKELMGDIKVLAKIEKPSAISNIDEIIEAADGVMIARGDLGIELPYYQVPLVQKQICAKARAAFKPCITATQMLFNLTENASATRAEISDVANAVLDASSALMLSEESAVGINPPHAVNVMATTIEQTELATSTNKLPNISSCDQTLAVLNSAILLASNMQANGLICLSTSGASLRILSTLRPNIPLIAATHSKKVLLETSLLWGFNEAFLIPEQGDLDRLIANTIKSGLEHNVLDLNHTYIITAGYPVGLSGSMDMIKILKRSSMQYYLNLLE